MKQNATHRGPPFFPYRRLPIVRFQLVHAASGIDIVGRPCCCPAQAKAMVLDLEDLLQSTPEVLELELKRMDMRELQTLESQLDLRLLSTEHPQNMQSKWQLDALHLHTAME